MGNYYLNVQPISRGKNRSVTKLLNYISGRTLHDDYTGRSYYHHRQDVIYQRIYLPEDAPPEFRNLQHLCDAINKAEGRYDARTAREFKGSLPNELPLRELARIVSEFIYIYFVNNQLAAIAAIHEGRNAEDPSKNNPHVHIVVSTRTVGPEGFSKRKDREHDKKQYIDVWREGWAEVQNRAYERNRLDVRVSHESLEVQGVRDREPRRYLSRIDWQKEQRGERTPAGDENRRIKERNEERVRQHQQELERGLEMDLPR